MDEETQALVVSGVFSWIIGGLVAGAGVSVEYSNGYGMLTFSAFMVVLAVVFGLWTYVKMRK